MELTIPELTAVHFGLLALALVVGLALGWFFRGERSAKEKIAVNAGWQDQLESLQAEQGRLAEQNKGLMEQISQYQNSHKESANRTKELSESLKESFQRRDDLQRELGDLRNKLELTVGQRNKLKHALEKQQQLQQSSSSGLKEKDDKIFRLSRELTSWQSRVPPLVEKFQQRDKQARQLEDELAQARKTIESYEDELAQARKTIESYEEKLRASQARAGEHTRIEPVDAGSLDGLDASNEPHTDTTAAFALSSLEDQIDSTRDDVAGLEELPGFPGDTLGDFPGLDDDLIAADIFVDDDDRRDDQGVAVSTTRRILEDDSAVAAAAADEGLDPGDDAMPADVAADLAESLDDDLAESLDDDLAESLDDDLAESLDDDLAESLDDDLAESLDDDLAEVAAAELPEDYAADLPEVFAGLARDDKDDLQQIKGVGPAIEKTLNDLGIYSFNQIAEMSEYEIDRVAQRVKGFRSRIYRQNWIGQARDLQHQKINNRP